MDKEAPWACRTFGHRWESQTHRGYEDESFRPVVVTLSRRCVRCTATQTFVNGVPMPQQESRHD